MTVFVKAARKTGEDPQPTKGKRHPHMRPHRHTHSPNRPNGSCWVATSVAVCETHQSGRETLAAATRMAAAGAVHPRARISGLVPRMGRLARQAVQVCGRDAVHGTHLAFSGRSRGAVAVVTTGAAVPGVGSVAC